MSEQKKQNPEPNETLELSDENLEDVSGGCFAPAPVPPIKTDPPIKIDPPIYYPLPQDSLK